ncbi:MAG: EAL domain-containing protein [Sulfuricurvum sp.]|jgi:diguanylate cyclase (GGDEF)-like protein|uniref:EAL domain-containing protein n=1 Tax=Sulfuricurvum sp. TaxID=2025608 RepID=UPI0025E66A2F|nr:EAL domain-containing protein [Sulfuricurvum sp.]MCK9373304.1 EAL domain-containing protein [Sulfuricurvum sp.]
MNHSAIFFKRLFEASPHPYLILRADDSYTIVAVNDYYLSATGIVRDQVIGKPLFDVFPDNPSDTSVSGVSDLHISLDSVVRYGRTDIMGVQKYDIPLRDGSGGFEVKYWSPVNAPIFADEGKVEYIIHNVEDVTDFVLLKEANTTAGQSSDIQTNRLEAEVLKRANEVKEANRLIKAREKEVAALNDKLKELDRLKTEFFSNISHEFRTPLTLMIAPVEELLNNRHRLEADRVAADLEIIHRNALRLLKLVNTLLDFSRIEAGRVRAAYEATDLSALTADLASNFSSASELAHVRLVVDCPPLPEWVEIDREMWEKIVLNLLSNAFKFTHNGSITVSIRSENNQAVLRVQDTGIGILEEELPKLFERFYRVANSHGKSYEGTGIGLALVQELVKLQGGNIEVASTVGEGTTFTVFMPLGIHEIDSTQPEGHNGKEDDKRPLHTQTYLAEATRWNRENRVSDQPTENTKGNVIVADDNADMREFIGRLLRDAGYSVSLAVDGEDAWEMCQQSLPDLIISDVMMPRLNGFELLKKIRSAEYTYSLPIILLSARAGESDKAQGLTSGADDYLSKPFHSGELIARVEGAVKLGKYRKNAHEQLLSQTNHIAKIGGWSFDTKTMKGAWTDELIRIHDLPPGETIDVRKGLDFYTPQSRPIIEKAMHDAITLGKPYDLELEIISATGAHKWVRTVGSPLIEEEKVTKVQGVMQDITRQKEDQIRIITEKERYDHLAHHDELTGLPNHLSLHEFMEKKFSENTRLAFMFLDLDGFKEINDSYGHRFGDKLLIDVTRLLQNIFPPASFIVRNGGDEFVVVVSCQGDEDDECFIETTMERLAGEFNHPFSIETREIYITASIGIAIHPDDAQTTEELLQCADTAMYNAKSSGKNTFSFYNSDLRERALYRMSITTNLKKALSNHELSLYYQPQVDPKSGQIVGVEALLRWFSPQGPISPASFIPIAEESGLILEIGEFVLIESFKTAKRWFDSNRLAGRIAVNVSAHQFTHTNFLSILERILEETHCKPEWIELEITERSILSNPEKMVLLLEELRDKGFHVSIDDFGTGYSSLSYLKNLPIDKLKIDISFVRNITREPKNQTIVKTIIALSKGLEMEVLAEGVESVEEMEFLRDHGIDFIQGYYFYKPAPGEMIETLM